MPQTHEKAVVVWVPPHQRPGNRNEFEEKLKLAKQAEAAARAALAKAKERHAEILSTSAELVLVHLRKYLRLAQSEDFANAIGPLEPSVILKLAEFVSKNHRLDTGQATENVAHALTPALDFSRLTQEERDQWRSLRLKVSTGGEQ